MNLSTPGLPVHHQLPDFTQTHVHRVSDATQPSHPLSPPSSPAPNPSQHQGLFQWVNYSSSLLKWCWNETLVYKAVYSLPFHYSGFLRVPPLPLINQSLSPSTFTTVEILSVTQDVSMPLISVPRNPRCTDSGLNLQRNPVGTHRYWHLRSLSLPMSEHRSAVSVLVWWHVSRTQKPCWLSPGDLCDQLWVSTMNKESEHDSLS